MLFVSRRSGAALAVSIATVAAALGVATSASAATLGKSCKTAGATSTSSTGAALTCAKAAGGTRTRWVATTLAPVAAPSTPAVVAPTKNLVDGCVTGATDGVDLFPDKATITDAKGLVISYQKTYKVVRVPVPWKGAKSGFTYVLNQCGAKAPSLTGYLAGATVIEVPIKTASIMSTTLAPQFDALGVADKIVSVDTPDFYSTAAVVKRIESGAVKGTGGGSRANIEQLVALKPSVVITYGTGSGSFDGIDKLQSANLPALVEAGYLEETPLGRAEWVKLIGALTNTEAKAEAEFARWKTDYRAIAAKVANVNQRPVVISGSMYQGTWFMPGGKSFVAQYIRDAGGAYPWSSDTSSGSLSLDFEAVLDKGYDATVWVNAGYLWNSLSDAVAEDSRYARLPSFRAGNVFGNDKRVNAKGGSDYFETAVVRPDLVLADMVAAIHPEIDLKRGSTTWFRRIAKS
jgi:iron complex transport system substrate-binding protein